MTKSNSTDARTSRKPSKTKPPKKLRKDFPLFAELDDVAARCDELTAVPAA